MTEAPPVPKHMHVVSSAAGYVGTFLSLEAARAAVLDAFSLVPFIVLQFPVAPGAPLDRVWVVPYRQTDAVAFVSNSRNEAERVRALYERVGLTYPDSVDYWEQPVGVVAEHAGEWLRAAEHAHRMYAGPAAAQEAEAADLERIERFLHPSADGPMARAAAENERISILDGVVPVELVDEQAVV